MGRLLQTHLKKLTFLINISNQCLLATENCDTFPNKSNAKKHLGCKKGKASQKQQLSDYTCD